MLRGAVGSISVLSCNSGVSYFGALIKSFLGIRGGCVCIVLLAIHTGPLALTSLARQMNADTAIIECNLVTWLIIMHIWGVSNLLTNVCAGISICACDPNFPEHAAWFLIIDATVESADFSVKASFKKGLATPLLFCLVKGQNKPGFL